MANQPIQLPNVDLPGAEYLSLSPNRTVAIQGRRRKGINVPAVLSPGPPSTDNLNAITTATLETHFLVTSGIYIHRFFAAITASQPGLTINNIFAGLTLQTPPFPDYPLGSPTLTNPSIAIGTALLIDRDILVTQRDIAAATVPTASFTGNLAIQLQLNVNNPEPIANPFAVYGLIVYTRLDGIVE